MKRLALLVLAICLALSAASSGEVKREIWNGAVSPPYGDSAVTWVENGTPPDQVDILDEPTWADIADYYVARMSGWLTVPETGEYTLYVAGDDYQRLYVSQDDNPANAKLVAYVDGWTQSQEWGKYESQEAAPMTLEAGQVLAFVGIMEERSGGDGQDWGWMAPGSEEIAVIPGEYFVAEHAVTGPTKAKLVSPANGAAGVIDAKLTWTLPSDGTVNVLFGTDPAALEMVAEGTTETSIDLGSAGAELDTDTTYYWRVDADGAEGFLWSFTTEPETSVIQGIIATSNAGLGDAAGGPQQTVDGSGLYADGGHSTELMDMWLGVPVAGAPVSIQYEFPRLYKVVDMKVWNSNSTLEGFLGCGFRDVTVEYSVDGGTWTVLADVEFAQAPGVEGYMANTTVDFGGVAAKYVRLTVNTGYGSTGQYGLSEVRFMCIPAQAREPQPADGAADVSVATTLDWCAGREAVLHEVYLGTDAEALPLVDSTTETSYTPDPLDIATTYFWQIVEVNEAEAITSWASDLWSFSTRDELVDITAPGDLVRGVPDDGTTTGGEDNGWPAAEYPALAIDNDVSTKYLHFKGDTEPTGFQITPAVGPTIVTGISFTTANDAPERDPVVFELYGSNDGIDGPYTLIAAGDIVDFAGDATWPRFTMNETPIRFDNTVPYAHYQIMFPIVRDPGSANSMQVAEVQLFSLTSGPRMIEVNGYVRNILNGEPIGSINEPGVRNVMFFPRGSSKPFHDNLSRYYGGREPGYYEIELPADEYDVNVVAEGYEMNEPDFEFFQKGLYSMNTTRDFLLWPVGEPKRPLHPVYRFKAPNGANDLWYFTYDESEMEDLLYDDYDPEDNDVDLRDPNNWAYAGIAFCGLESPAGQDTAVRCWTRRDDPNAIPAYAFEVSDLEPLDPSDKWDELNNGNAVFHAYRNQQEETTAVYRFWSPSSKCYFYTMNPNEPATPQNGAGDWEPRSVAWHVLTQEQSSLP